METLAAILSIFSVTTLSSVVSASAPIVFASLGETLNERAGVINLSVEGSMMLGAMAGFVGAQTTGSVFWGFVAAMLVGMLMAAIVAFGSITLKRDQVAIGFILTILGIELSSFLGSPYVRQPGPRISSLPIPVLKEIPVIGPIFFDQDVITYLSLILAVGMWLWFYKTITTCPQPG